MYKYGTLVNNHEFKRVYNRGGSSVHPLLVTYIFKNNKGITRIGLTATKKIGKAVERNRARRVIKAAIAELKREIPPGYDIVFVARAKTTTVKMQDVLKVLEKHLQNLYTQTL